MKQLGRYVLAEKIGEGGMAEVYRARLPGAAGFEKTVVIKRMLPEVARKPEMSKMFITEAKLAGAIEHKNIVQVFGLEETSDGELFMVLEFIDGPDLRQILRASIKKRLRIPPWFAIKVVADILGGLSMAHELLDDAGRPRNIVHRDVSPSNIFISRRGEVKLGDFGIAKDHSKQERTLTGMVKGKLGYMSPEQLYHRPLDQRSDLFAAGTVLWEILTQKRLFGGKRPEIETMNLICSSDRIPPSQVREDVPKKLDECVLRALRPPPPQRFQSARAFQHHLLDILSELKPRVLEEDVRHVVEQILPDGPAEEDTASLGSISQRTEDSGRSSFGSSSEVLPPPPDEEAAEVIFDLDVAAKPPLTLGPSNYDGPHPFYVEGGGIATGPMSYFDALPLARESAAARLSPDGRSWMHVARFATLTGQEALFDPDATRDLSSEPDGLLEARSVTSIISELVDLKATKKLTIAAHRGGRDLRADLLFSEGGLESVTSTLYRLQLPEVLTTAGMVSASQLPEIFHRVLTVGDPMEAFVADLRPELTEEAIRGHLLRERLVSVLSWREGSFATSPIEPRPIATTDALRILPEVLPRALSPIVLRELLAENLAQPFTISRRFSRRVTSLGLSQTGYSIALALARGETINQLLEQSPENAHLCLATAYLLREAKLLT